MSKILKIRFVRDQNCSNHCILNVVFYIFLKEWEKNVLLPHFIDKYPSQAQSKLKLSRSWMTFHFVNGTCECIFCTLHSFIFISQLNTQLTNKYVYYNDIFELCAAKNKPCLTWSRHSSAKACVKTSIASCIR